MGLKYLYVIAKCQYRFNLLADDNENNMLMLNNCWILDRVGSFFFFNKTFRRFKNVCIKK